MRNADKEFVQKDMELLNLEDKQFEDYATRVISYMEDHGRNTYPMKKVIKLTFSISQHKLILQSKNSYRLIVLDI